MLGLIGSTASNSSSKIAQAEGSGLSVYIPREYIDGSGCGAASLRATEESTRIIGVNAVLCSMGGGGSTRNAVLT